MNYTLDDVIIVYMLRDTRRIDPDGEFDKAGRWYPSEEERRPCCGKIYPPSRVHPYRLLKHCRTLSHTAQLYGVDETIVHKEYRKPYWKVVRKLIQLSPRNIYMRPRSDVRPMQQYSEKILKSAIENAEMLTEREISMFVEWFSQYRPDVNDINWEALRAMNALRRSE